MCDGHPAKVRGLNVIGLKRGDFPSSIRKDLRKAFKIIFKSKLSLPSALKKVENEIEKTAELSHLIDFIRSSKRGISR
jgi:UDP-N-acetylglucosamine acyltransferase